MISSFLNVFAWLKKVANYLAGGDDDDDDDDEEADDDDDGKFQFHMLIWFWLIMNLFKRFIHTKYMISPIAF